MADSFIEARGGLAVAISRFLPVLHSLVPVVACKASGLIALGAFDAAHAQSNLSAEDRAVVQQAQGYLQALTSAQGTFTETGPNGQTRQGRFYLQRPGKMRFEYTTPAGLLVVSDGSNVKRYDPRLNVFRQVPLSATPAMIAPAAHSYCVGLENSCFL